MKSLLQSYAAARGADRVRRVFLEVDPHFFRSGYLKQILLTRIKRSVLTARITRRLRALWADAVERRGTREFKYYCRLAARIADDGLRAQLARLAAQGPSARASRARRMWASIAQRATELEGATPRAHSKPRHAERRTV